MSILKRSFTALAGCHHSSLTVWLGCARTGSTAAGRTAGSVPSVLRNYQPVTAERLQNPEPGNWLMIRRTYDGWGYSPLNEITTANVARLRLVWTMPTGEGASTNRRRSSTTA